MLDAPLTSSNGTTITGIEGIATLTGDPACSGPSPTPTRARPSPTSPPAAARSWSTGATAPLPDPGRRQPHRLGSPNGVIFSINASHTYAEEGTYAYTVTVTDDGGRSPSSPARPIIADAPLTPAATQPTVNTTEAAIFPVPVFARRSSTAGRLVHRRQPRGAGQPTSRPRIDWGDGTPMTAGTVSQPGGVGTDLRRHRHAHLRRRGRQRRHREPTPIQVFVQDDGGSRLTVTNTANVADMPISLTGAQPASDSGKFEQRRDHQRQPAEFLRHSPSRSRTSCLFATLTGGPRPIGQVQAGSDGAWNITQHRPGRRQLRDHGDRRRSVRRDHDDRSPVIAPNLLIDTVGPAGHVTRPSID